jgi:hypothetical protein
MKEEIIKKIRLLMFNWADGKIDADKFDKRLESIFSSLEKEVMRAVPEAVGMGDKSDAEIGFESGFNDCREEIIDALKKIFR